MLENRQQHVVVDDASRDLVDELADGVEAAVKAGVTAVATVEHIAAARAQVQQVHVDDSILRYIVELCRELIARTGIDPATLDEVIVGCVGQPHDQANVGRVVSLRAGVPQHVPARTVARNCASGIEAVTSAATLIEAGRGDLFLAAGVEVMSGYPLVYGPEMTDMFARLSGP